VTAAGFVWDPRVATHVYRDDHPLKPIRLVGVHDTLERLGAFARDGARVLDPRAATRAEIERIHDRDYVEAVMQASREPDGDYTEWGLAAWGDTPPFEGMHDISLLTTGGTLTAMEEVIAGRLRVAFNGSGGLHHAMRRNASGFCVYNDPAIVCGLLADRGMKVAYVDIDAHHGDGVQAAFYDTDRVLTMSFVEGLTMSEFLKTKPSQSIRDAIGSHLVELYYFQLHKLKTVHADHHPRQAVRDALRRWIADEAAGHKQSCLSQPVTRHKRTPPKAVRFEPLSKQLDRTVSDGLRSVEGYFP